MTEDVGAVVIVGRLEHKLDEREDEGDPLGCQVLGLLSKLRWYISKCLPQNITSELPQDTIESSTSALL